ncbi:putative glucooligosaccharide oxidase [Jackrogersella minutella]|nr:putative glucooligosaccharide oxidase [Jackrogersella minutella]
MASPNVDIEAIARHFRLFDIPFSYHLSPNWTVVSSTYNIRVPVIPAIVVIPRYCRQISNTVLYARMRGLRVQVRSGGHSYNSSSNGGQNGAIVIDMSAFDAIEQYGTYATIFSGARLGNMAASLYDVWHHALPHGTCSTVGVGGHFSHGGFGFFSRAWGLALDRIIEMKVITANGQPQNINENKQADLYWAMRGAAESFGVIISFQVQPVPAPQSIVHFKISIDDVTKDFKSATKALRRIQKFTRNESVVDRQLGFYINLSPAHFTLGGTYLGSRQKFEETIMPAMLKGIPEKATSQVEEKNWMESLKHLNQNQDILWDRKKPFTMRSNFFAKSIVVPEPGYTKTALKNITRFIYKKIKNPPVKYFIMLDLWGGADSQINVKGQDFAAFSIRDALWVTQIYGYVDDNQVFPEAGMDFINQVAQAMKFTRGDPRAYSNYADPTLTREQALHYYHGPSVARLLWILKQKWDPYNIFAGPQTVPLEFPHAPARF